MRTLVLLGCASVALTAFGLSVAWAGEPHRVIDVSRVFDAGAPPTAPPSAAITRTPPDPAPLVARSQWVFDLRWERGEVWLLGANKVELSDAQATPRAMGRFAVELFEGPVLIERVRFDFPLLAVPDPAAPGDGIAKALPSLTQKLRTRIGVVFPVTERGTRLELWDRATDHRWSLPWPPTSTNADAGVPDAGTPVAAHALAPPTRDRPR